MKDHESESPVDGTYGPKTIEVLQEAMGVESRPAFDEMTAREQALHLYLEHGFDSAYFYGYFSHWGDDSPALKYDMESMAGVLAFFEMHEDANGRHEWHWPEHEPDGDDPFGGGDIKHMHRPSTQPLPPDVIDSLDDAFNRDGN